MNLFIPANLDQHLRELGPKGVEWRATLPERIRSLEQTWRFHTGPAFDHHGAVSWVAPVTLQDGSPAVLKIGIPHNEARFEADALRFLNGRAAVRLMQASEDGFSLLLERCLPGTDLWSLRAPEADAIACVILPQLWQKPDPTAPFLSLADSVKAWWRDLPQRASAQNYDPKQIAQIVELSHDLLATQPAPVLLHGDFHPANILAAQRSPWLAIDPKPLVGDPAYDLAQWLYNRSKAAIASKNPIAALREQIDAFANALALDPSRIAGWAFVKALGWDWGPEIVGLFQKILDQ